MRSFTATTATTATCIFAILSINVQAFIRTTTTHSASYISMVGKKLFLCPEQAQQLVAASCSENAYCTHANSNANANPLNSEENDDFVLSNQSSHENKVNESTEKDEKSKAFLSRIMSASPNLIPHIWENWTGTKLASEEDEYVSPIVGFQWVRAHTSEDGESEMVVLPSSSSGTRCRVPNQKEELVGWFNEVCHL